MNPEGETRPQAADAHTQGGIRARLEAVKNRLAGVKRTIVGEDTAETPNYSAGKDTNRSKPASGQKPSAHTIHTKYDTPEEKAETPIYSAAMDMNHTKAAGGHLPSAGTKRTLADAFTPMSVTDNPRPTTAKKSSGLRPPRAPKSLVKSDSKPSVKSVAKSVVDCRGGFLISSPDGKTYVLRDHTGWLKKVRQWSMSRYRVSFLLTDGTVLVFPFLKREKEGKDANGEINESLISSDEGGRILDVIAWGHDTFTIVEGDAEDKQRRIKKQTGHGPTECLDIQGLEEDSLICRVFPGEGYLVVLYQNNKMDVVLEGKVDEIWRQMAQETLGEHSGKEIRDIAVGGRFILVQLASGELFCISKCVLYYEHHVVAPSLTHFTLLCRNAQELYPREWPTHPAKRLE